MLTIKPPIQLRCRFPMEAVHSDLAEKIMGNYTLMNNFIRKEELLYVTTQAPEVYFAEGNSISILNDIKNENKQEIRLDVINHLINRILMSHTDNFCYQDTVYISNVLRKLGIQDVSNFMKQVYRLREEKNENNQLIDLYEEQKNILMNIFKEEENNQTDKKSDANDTQNIYENKYYIHEEIFNRLNTKNVYEDIRNYTQGINNLTKKITNNEVAVSEQISMIQNFNLHELKKNILNNESPIYYYHANQYELVENDNMDETDAEARISSAILLNLVDNIYSLRLKQIENNSHNWYSVAGALFKSAENTWLRYEINHKEGKKVSADMYNTMVDIVNSKKSEKNIISNIVKEINILNEENSEVVNQNAIDEMIIKNSISNLVKEAIYNYDENYVSDSFNNIFNFNLENQENKLIVEDLKNELQTIKNEINQEDIKVIRNINEIIKNENNIDINIENNEELIKKVKNEIISNNPKISTFMYDGLMEVINNNTNSTTIISDIINEIKVLNQYEELSDNTVTSYETKVISNIQTILADTVYYNNESFKNEVFNKIINEENLHKEIINQSINELAKHLEMKNNFIYDENNKIVNNLSEIVQRNLNADIVYQNEEKLLSEIKTEIINNKSVNNTNINSKLVEALNSSEENIDIINKLTEIAGQTEITVMNNTNAEEIINSLNNEFNIANSMVGTDYETVSELIHTTNVSEEENTENITEITEETLKYFDEINRKNIENYKKILEIENQRPSVKNVTVNRERARKDALRALENPNEVFNEIINSEIKDEHKEISYKLDEQIYNLFSDETKNIFEQVIMRKNGQVPMQFPEQAIVHKTEEYEDTNEVVRNIVNKEYISEIINNNNVSKVDMIAKPAITYEINETIKNEINQLRNMEITNLYESYFGKEEKVKKKRGRKSKAVIEKEKKKERENLELQHFMEQAEQEDKVVEPVKPQVQRTKEVGLVHKIEEQFITEELINTIKNRTVDNIKEETVEHNQIHNINRNEKSINETVNQIKVTNQENIDEIVKQNVKKQLNQLTDQVYGKIEKKLQTERKRRGY